MTKINQEILFPSSYQPFPGENAGSNNPDSGHYTVKSKRLGFQCLRCRKSGESKQEVESQRCPCPKAKPRFDDNDDGDEKGKPSCKRNIDAELNAALDDHLEQKLREEMAVLKHLQEELETAEAIEREKEILEALMMEQAKLESEGETDQDKKALAARMAEDMVTMGFTQEMASWAVQESKAEWGKALDLLNKQLHEEEEAKIASKNRKDDNHSKTATMSKRKPATPCASTTMPPPPVPKKKSKPPSPKSDAPVCNLT